MAIRQIGNNTFVGLFSELPATGTSGTVFVAENTNGVYYYFSGGTSTQIGNSLTSGRVGYGSTSNTLTDSSRFLWDNTNSQLELNGNLFGIKLKENINNRYITISNGSLGSATLVMKNQLNQTLFNLNNPVNANDSAQLAIGDVNSIPAESQLYIYGGNNGANIDMRGKPSRDECNIDFEGNDWEVNPNSLGMSYFGALFSASTATTLNYPKQKMGVIRWGEANKAVIVSNNSTGMTPIMLGINDIEIGQVNDKGFEYKSKFASANTSNNRWLTDKQYVDSSVSGVTLQNVTDAGNTTTNFISSDKGFFTQTDYTNMQLGAEYLGGSGKLVFQTNGDGIEFSTERNILISANIEEAIFLNYNDELDNTSSLSISGTLNLSHSSAVPNSNINLYLDDNGLGIQTTSSVGYLRSDNITDIRTHQLPNEDGEFALKSNNWATGSLQLGSTYAGNVNKFSYYETGDGIDVPSGSTVSINANPEEGLELQKASATGSNSVYINDAMLIRAVESIETTLPLFNYSTVLNSSGFGIYTAGNQGYLKTDDLSDIRTYQLPDASGTVALTSDILKTKSGSVTFASFTGSPYSYNVVFATAFADALYSPSIIGVDARSWTVSNVTASGFRIETNSSTILTGSVYWVATKHGEN